MHPDPSATEDPKTIGMVANSSWYLYNLRLGVIRALQRVGFRIVIIAPEDGYTSRLVNEGCEVIPVKVNGKSLNPFEDLRYAYALHSIYRTRKFHYVFHYTIKPVIYGSVAAALQGTKSISIISGLGYSFIRKAMLSRVVGVLYKLANHLAEEVWFVNRDNKRLFENAGIVKPAKSKLLPGEGVNPQHFKRSYTHFAKESIQTHFIFSGRLIWTKGVGEFVQAARITKEKYPDTVFSILGFTHVNNPDAVPVETIDAWNREGVIRYLGSTEDVRPYLESASCVVLPSYYGEGTPRSLLEAACMEVPIIPTDHDGCREIVIDGYNGLLCRKHSASDLAQKMEAFFQLNSAQRTRLGKNGRALMLEKFDESLVIHQYLKKLSSRKRSVIKRLRAPQIPVRLKMGRRLT